MSKIVKIEWATIERHEGWFEVEDDFDQDNYDLPNELADFDEDCFNGLVEREDIQVYAMMHCPPETDLYQPEWIPTT